VDTPRARGDIRLSIVVATGGRATLDDALASATAQMRPGDELLVVFDDAGDAGDTPRNRVLDSLHGTHVMFLDDDDELLPGALDAVRAFAAENPGRWGLFQLDRGPSGVIWERGAMQLMAAATAMCVVPNVPERLGRFGRVPGAPAGRLGDYPFVVETAASLGDPVWCEVPFQVLRPEKRTLRRLRYRLALRTRLRRALGRPIVDYAPVRSDPEAERWGEERMEVIRRQLGSDAPLHRSDEPEVWRPVRA
jgi:glycosyltransferase involved in cell wall biosynthesis